MATCRQDTDSSGGLGSPSSIELQNLRKKKIMFVIGGPGSGKGTMCDRIVQKYGFCHVSTGDLLRDEVQNDPQRAGPATKSTMDKGELVPLEQVLQLLKEAMLKLNKQAKGFLIDGYPRTLEQGQRFEKDVAPIEGVLYFQISDDTMVKRILKRGETSGRPDDNEATVKQRIAKYHQTNYKIVNYYSNLHKLHTVDGEGTIEDTFAQVCEFMAKATA